jgi:biotin transporter BioY
MGFLIGFPLFIVAPCVIAAWVGTRVRSPVIALVVTWLLTPLGSLVITVLGTPILRAITPANNDGTFAIMLPFFGIVTGLIAGIVASVIVKRRSGEVTSKPDASDQHVAETFDGR